MRKKLLLFKYTLDFTEGDVATWNTVWTKYSVNVDYQPVKLMPNFVKVCFVFFWLLYLKYWNTVIPQT